MRRVRWFAARATIAAWRRLLTAVSVLAAAWAFAIVLTGGFAVSLSAFSVSSRNPRNPALIAVVSAIVAVLLPVDDRRQATRRLAARWSARLARLSSLLPRGLDAPLVMALLGAIVLTSAWYGARPLWLDEEMIALNVRERSLWGLAGALWLDQSAPLGWLALERLALSTLGPGERALRLVPMSFGLATLAAAVWVARRWFDRRAGSLFVLLCAVGSWIAHYPLELKHYSADVFWALVLPAVAIRVTDQQHADDRSRRAWTWWTLAALAHWFSNGGLLVLPACAALLLAQEWRNRRWRGVAALLVGGVVVLASFAAHYLLSIRHTLGSAYLRDYWSGGLPPEGGSVVERVLWLGSQMAPLARNPAGTELTFLFWAVVAIGCVTAPPRPRILVLLVPVTAFALGALAVVPLLDRVALWIVPMLYAAVTYALVRALQWVRDGMARRRSVPLLAGAALAVATLFLCVDIAQRGWQGVESRRVGDQNHGLDDRGAIRWLLSQRQPGDVIVTTHMGLPAVWWYGDIPIATTSGIFEASYQPSARCVSDLHGLRASGARRALVFVGFPDAPEGFADLLVHQVAQLGAVRADRVFAVGSRAAVVEFGAGREPRPMHAPSLDGCVAVRAARRW